MDGLRLVDLRIVEDDLSGQAIAELLAFHLSEMHRWSPACKVHALPIESLRQPGVTFYSSWVGDALAACGALREIDPEHGELKSMRAAPEWRGKGVGEAVLHHLIAVARARGYRRLSLETGRPEAFRPAQALYRKHGFEECPPFGDYVSDDFSMCMTKVL